MPVLKPLDQTIPGLNNLTGGASAIIQNLLQGLPSPDQSRLDNAYFGAGSGLDTSSPFLQSRGRELYGARAEQRQQQGIDNLLKMLGTYSGTVSPSTGEQQRANEQSYSSQWDIINKNQAETDKNRAFQQNRMDWWGQHPNEVMLPGSGRRVPKDWAKSMLAGY